MAELSLPSTVDYNAKIPVLPDNVSSNLYSIQSTNGISFTAGQVIQWDLPARQGLFLDGTTAFIRYKVSVTGGTATAPIIKRKPVYTFINKLDEFIGSVPVSSVYQYNQVANMWVDINYSVADVAGQCTAWGFEGDNTFSDVDGVVCTGNATKDFYVSAPLVCSALSSYNKLLPTGIIPSYRVQLTLASIVEAFTVSANVTSYTISQPELCFQGIDLGVAVENALVASGQKFHIRSTGWANTAQSAPSTSTGYQVLPFNQRYQSIENCYLLATMSDSTKALNTWGDSWNFLGTAGTNASVQMQIGNLLYPTLPINNATGSLASIFQYLRQCSGNIQDQRNTMCINYTNFMQYANGATASTANVPAKFIVGFPLERMQSSSPYKASALLSGVDARQSPINLMINVGSAFNSAVTFNLISQYTSLLEIDPVNKQVNVVC